MHAEIAKLMDEIAPTEPSDNFAKRMIELLKRFIDENSPTYFEVREAMRIAYTKSQDFEEQFQMFAGQMPEQTTESPIQEISELKQ